MERNEGVGIMLDPAMVSLWKDDGEIWSPVSSCVVSARLKLSDQVVSASARWPLYVSVVSAYAPTHRASQEQVL